MRAPLSATDTTGARGASGARRLPRLGLLGALALVLLASVSAPAAPTAPRFPYAVASAACVEILVDDHLWGSGWIASPEGLVLTAAHCVREPGRVEVLWQKRRILAKRVASDLGNDLALLQLPRRDENYPALVLAKAPPAPTTPIWLLGTPIYRHGVLLAGVAGAPGTTHEWYTRLGRYVRVMHVTATTPPGVSGGPWMNARGEVLALHSGTMTRNDVPVGVGFAVPCTAIAAFLERGRTVATPTLGAAFEEVWEQARSALERYPPRTEGVVVMSPVANGPLADAGVEQWQVVTAIDGHPIRYRDDLLSYVRRQEVGETVALSLLLPDRGGREIVRVVLGAMR